MILESDDRLFVEITPTHMTLQILEECYTADLGEERGECDTYVLSGRQAARFMWLLRMAGNGVPPPDGNKVIVPGDGKRRGLSVGYADETFFIYGDSNTATLTKAEMYALLCSMSTRMWRMFT